MFRKFLTLALSACVVGGSIPAFAEETSAPQTASAAPADVPAALARMKFLHGTPDTSAKYYIYLQSASWCGPCHQAMPYVVAAYQEMKSLGFEFILLSHDREAMDALELVTQHKLPFAVALASDAQAANLPGYTEARGIPLISMVSPTGNVFMECHPYYFFPRSQWKMVYASYEAPRGAVKDALPQVRFLQGTPAPDARYYVYLACGNTCAPCHQAMPRVVQAYGELRAQGVEVIMCCRDDDETTRKYAARYNVPFPVLSTAGGNGDKLPGFRNPGDFGIPRVFVVRADGSPVWEGHPIRFFPDQEWKKHIKGEETAK